MICRRLEEARNHLGDYPGLPLARRRTWPPMLSNAGCILRPLVFVAMPFGQKRDDRLGCVIDFDAIYNDGIKPALDGLQADVIRADEERSGGIIHVAMFERLLLAEIAIVDVTIDNANVFYELGVRHTAKGYSTIIVCSKDRILPFDIGMIRAVPYTLDAGAMTKENAAAFAASLRERVVEMLKDLEPDYDSPLFQLIPKYEGVPLSFDAASFRERTLHLNDVRAELMQACHREPQETAQAAIAEIEQRELGFINEANSELVVDVLLSYRDVKAFDAALALVNRLPKDMYNRSIRIRQLHAFALKERNQGDDRTTAIGILQQVVSETGDNPETCGLLGGIFKPRYDAAKASGDTLKAKASLSEAIKWYRRGYLADPRDYYPGINLCTLLAVDGSAQARAELGEILPAVRLAVKRSGGIDSNDYWVVATALELAVLANDWDAVQNAYARILVLVEGGPNEQPQPWMLESTGRTFARLRDAGIDFIDKTQLQGLIDTNDRALADETASAAT